MPVRPERIGTSKYGWGVRTDGSGSLHARCKSWAGSFTFMSGLKYCREELLPAIDPVAYYQQEFPLWDGEDKTKVICPKHGDTTASLSLDPTTGAFYCFGCKWKGSWCGGFHTDLYHDGKWKSSVRDLYRRYIAKVLDPETIKRYRASLAKKPKVVSMVTRKRGWSPDTMELHRLGWWHKKKRIAIPIFNPGGVILDVRYHDSTGHAPLVKGKRVGTLARLGGRTGDWFPFSPWLNPFRERAVWLVEGEPDAILANQDDLNAVTLTGGVGQWLEIPYQSLCMLRGKDVVICFDNDKAGSKAAHKLAERLAGVEVRSLKNIVVPSGNDITEFFMKYDGSASQLLQTSVASPWLFKPKDRVSVALPLAKTSEAAYVGKTVQSDVLVTTKWHSPVIVPRRLEFNCLNVDRCNNCPCADGLNREHVIHRDDPAMLDWLHQRSYEKMLKKEYMMETKCRLTIEVLEHQTLEPITLVPALSSSRNNNEASYVERSAYFLGHGLEANQNYRVKATPNVHPRTRESVLMVEEAHGTRDTIQDFNLNGDEVTRLRKLFRGSPASIIQDICKLLSLNHTRIYGRWDLHAVVDLCFHSPMSFTFADTRIPKGSLEVLLFGDTRCGKGQVAEGISRFYDLGSVVCGESASFMGLVGGAKTSDRGFVLQWGRFPTNHGRLVIVDEFAGFRDMAKMSRIRSEGIAELDKGGIHAKTAANVRLIWIANGRNGRDLASYSSGIAGIKDLIKADEDIARFDLAMVVAKGEVDIEEINARNHQFIKSRFTPEDLRLIVLWIWSRHHDDVVFSSQATTACLSAANYVAKRYSPSIPLLQGENARFKVAKLAASIAGRCFSTDAAGQRLLVKAIHVRTAVSFLRYLYDKPVMGYLAYSQLERASSKLQHEENLVGFFKRKPPAMRRVLLDGLLSIEAFSIQEVMDLTQTEMAGAKRITALLVQSQAVKQITGGLYRKKPEFIELLRRLKVAADDEQEEESPF